jgi:hypothetical protein
MNEKQKIDALLTAGRRYCLRESLAARTAGRESTEEQTQTGEFFLCRLREEIERFYPSEFESLEEARKVIRLAAETWCPDPDLYEPGEDEREIIESERADFIAYLQSCGEEFLAEVAPLPYCHVLTREESRDIWRRVEERWGIRERIWYPLTDIQIEDEVIAFRTTPFATGLGSEPLRKSLLDRGVKAIYLLFETRQNSPEYEMDVSMFDLGDNVHGDRPERPGWWFETFWTSRELDWLIYFSHEDTFAVGGSWLIDAIKAAWPDWDKCEVNATNWTDIEDAVD